MRSRTTSTEYPVKKWDFSQPNEAPDYTGSITQEFSQDLVINQNNGFKRDRRNSKGAVGGDFLVYRRFLEQSSTIGNDSVGFSYDPDRPARPYYICPQFAAVDNVRNGHFPLPLPSDRSLLNSLATDAISKIAPNKPEASLSSFLGELREGLPHAIGLGRSGRQRAKRGLNAGDEYLNIEFGWKPLVRDVQSFAKAVQNSERILAQFERGAGKLIRRGYEFPSELEVEGPIVVNPNTTMVPTLNGFHYGSIGTGVLERETRTLTERWFSASFMYALPPGGTPQNYSAKANKLLGTNLSPEMLWNLTPWSWALDWAGNAGTLASNLTLFNSDCLVMPWNYIMEKKTTSVEFTWRSHGADVYRSFPGRIQARQKFTTEMKYRQQGTPYGFKIDWPDFTASQLAILASLGISR